MGSNQSKMKRKEKMKKPEQDHDLQKMQADLESTSIRAAKKNANLEMKNVDAESKRVELDTKKDTAASNVQIKLEEKKAQDEVPELMKKRTDLESELKKLETNPDHVTTFAKDGDIADSNSSERACIIETEFHEDNLDQIEEEFVSKMKQQIPNISG